MNLDWVGPDDPRALLLATAQQAELDSLNPPGHVPYALHDDIEFVVVSVNGQPVACGALQPLDAETGELKRMYVVPSARRDGLGKVVLAAVEERARCLGLTRLRLETAENFTAAVALYRSCGYQPIAAFGEYVGDPTSYCMERVFPVAVPGH